MGHSYIGYTQPFRAEDWWKSKAALLMGFVYLFGLWFNISISLFIPLSLLSIMVIVGFASFGYVVNDFFDKEKDLRAGKKNYLIGKSTIYQWCLVSVTIIFIVLPWVYLPANSNSAILIVFEILLFLMYSLPPIRLKERGIASLITDALYAHALPVSLAAYTFLLASGHRLSKTSLGFLFLWQLTCGIRNIVLHQSEDKGADTLSQTRNFVASLRNGTLQNILLSTLILEFLFSWIFFVCITLEKNEIILCLFLVASSYIIAFIKFKNIDTLVHSGWRYFPNNIYEKWLPPVYLFLLCFSNEWFLLFLAIHLALFNFDFYIQLIRHLRLFRNWLSHVIIPVGDFFLKYSSLFVNYLIYYALLVIGVNLKKENKSAMEYFKKVWKK